MSVGQKEKSNALIRKILKRSREVVKENQIQLGREIITVERNKLGLELQNFKDKLN